MTDNTNIILLILSLTVNFVFAVIFFAHRKHMNRNINHWRGLYLAEQNKEKLQHLADVFTNNVGYSRYKEHATLTKIAKHLELAMDKKDYSIADVAAASGVSTSVLYKMKSAKKGVSRRSIERIARVLDVHPVILMYPDTDNTTELMREKANR